MGSRSDQLSRFLEQCDAAVKVEVTAARGSTPREAGTFMLVSAEGLYGTIGGGQLEMLAITQARKHLTGAEPTGTMRIPLGPEIGQCCGGNVSLSLNRLDRTTREQLLAERRQLDEALPQVFVFGAGHVGKALSQALSLLPLNTVLVETRQNELQAATAPVAKRLEALPESVIAEALPGAAFVVLTHDHGLDFLIVQTALARQDAAYVGMIGSKTKRASYLGWHVREGGERGDADRLVCPIGGKALRDKRPEVIAALAAAEIMTAVALAHA